MDGKQPKPKKDEPFSFLNSVIVVGGWEEPTYSVPIYVADVYLKQIITGAVRAPSTTIDDVDEATGRSLGLI